MKTLVKDFFTKEDGQGMVEYGLIIALVAVVAIVGVKLLGGNAKSTFDSAAAELTVS